MARDVVDAALGRRDAGRRPSRTKELPLVGAAARSEIEQIADSLVQPLRDAAAARGETRAPWPPRVARRLVDRHGRQAVDVMALAHDLDMVAPVGLAVEHLEDEVVWAVRHELALTLDDVLSRRMRLAQELPDRGASIAPRAADILADELGWSAQRREREIAAYLATARREYGVPRSRLE